MDEAVVVCHSDELHGCDDIPFVKGQKETEQYGEQYKDQYEKDIGGQQEIG
jgi:hypothetical protein